MKSLSDSTRLFDCIEFQLNSPLQDMLAAKKDGEWVKYSSQEVAAYVNDLSAGLLKLGLAYNDPAPEGRHKVAVISKNRPEWLILDMAVQRIGAVLTPIYPTIHINELEFILNDAAVKIVFVNDAELYNTITAIRHRLPSLQDIYSFDAEQEVKHWKEILLLSTPALKLEASAIANQVKPADLATIIYTSGTTGTPKGVMLSHENILSNVMSSLPCFPPGDNLRALSFLPLNHIFERMISYVYLYKRTSIYYAESLEAIGENLKEIKPDIFTTVPRMLEKVYDKIMAKGRELKGVKRKLFFWAHDLATKFDLGNKSISYRVQLSVANKLVFKKWREALGGGLVCIISGGAACQVRLIKIFTAANIPIMEGYGLTETSPVISVNRFDTNYRMIGTVGPVIDQVQVKIAEDGEILCKGANVMMGYYKQPALTAEVIEDGWFKTGDIGVMVNNTFLKITDRKKEMFKTSGGKYVAPLPIENKLKESVYVENVMIVGAGQKFAAALIIPSFANLREWCRRNNVVYTSDEKMITEPRVIELYKDLVQSFNTYFNQVEQIKKFELLPIDWSVAGGEMTPKLSLKRKVVMEKYKDAVEKIYS